MTDTLKKVTPPTENVGTKILFENDRVRVWDQVLPPGGTLEKHIHRVTHFYLIVSGGLIRFVNPDDATDYKDVQFEDDHIGFHEITPGNERIDNRLINVGQKTHRAIVVEFKPAPPGGYDRSHVSTGAPHGGKTPPADAVGTRLMLANDWVRIWDLSLAPGEQLAKHIHKVDNFYVVISGGLIRFGNPDDESDYRDIQFQDEQVTFHNVPPEGKIDNRLLNIGTKHHRNFLIELLK